MSKAKKKKITLKNKKAVKPAKKVLVKKKVKKFVAKKIIKPKPKAVPRKKPITKRKPTFAKKNPTVRRKKTFANKKIAVKKVLKKVIKKSSKPRRVAKQKIKRTHSKQHPKGNNEFPAETFFRARIKVIGIGGGGGSIVSEIGRSLEKATFVVADTDIRALKKKSGIKYLWFGEELTHGLGTGVNVELAKQAAESAKEKLSGIFQNQDIIVFIASLGGGLGSGATQVFADAAREFGGVTFGIFTMPFKFEGKNKQRIAQNALKSLRQSLNVSLVIPNEKIFKIIDANTAITDAFSIVNKSLIESLESLIDLIYNPGIINIDFADLRTILKGIGNTAFLNTVEESGKDRAEKICEKVLVNPLLQNSDFEVEKILFNIAGSDNLSMFEVEKISSHIANTNPKAKIIFGISKSSKLKNKIKTTILMTGGAEKESVPIKKPEIKKSEPIGFIEEKKIEESAKSEAVAGVLKENKKTIAYKKPLVKKLKEEKKNSEPEKPKITKPKNKKPTKPEKKTRDKKQKLLDNKEKEQGQPSFIPVFEVPAAPVPSMEQRKMNITETIQLSNKKTIRRSGLEIRKAEEQEEKKRIAQEKEWEIPAFLRRIKYKS